MMLSQTMHSLVIVGIVFSTIVVSTSASSEVADESCDGYTLDKCNIVDEDVLFESMEVENASLCQLLCSSFVHCKLFRKGFAKNSDKIYTNETCQLLTREYRASCARVGGRVENSVAHCKNSVLKGCEAFTDESCAFLANDIGFEIPNGEIQTPEECESLCKGFEASGCNYWVFDYEFDSCDLLESDLRDCAGVAGPEAPDYDSCLGNSTTIDSP